MNSGEIMVVVIVAIVMVASVLKTLFRIPHAHQDYLPNAAVETENKQLRSEVQELKERIKVLERITVEKENSLAKEIESLRDR
jgi:hypothetical protein